MGEKGKINTFASLNSQHISAEQAIKLTQQHIQDNELAFNDEHNNYYVLNDRTLDNLMKSRTEF